MIGLMDYACGWYELGAWCGGFFFKLFFSLFMVECCNRWLQRGFGIVLETYDMSFTGVFAKVGSLSTKS